MEIVVRQIVTILRFCLKTAESTSYLISFALARFGHADAVEYPSGTYHTDPVISCNVLPVGILLL